MFVGVPHLRNLDDVCRLKLALDDFAVHDPGKDALFNADAAAAAAAAAAVTRGSSNARRGLFGVLFGKVTPSVTLYDTYQHIYYLLIETRISCQCWSHNKTTGNGSLYW